MDALDTYIVEQPVLKAPPLRQVICQMRFQEILGLADRDVRPLQLGLAEEYPEIETEEMHEVLPVDEGLRPTGKVRSNYRFTDADGAWTVLLTPTSLALDTTAYVDFRGFAERWRRISSLVADELEITLQLRLGLRYVNELGCPSEPTPADLGALVRSELVGIVGGHDPRTMRPISSLQEARFAQSDGICTFRHGLVSRTADDGRRLYVLDYDYYSDDKLPLDLDAQLKQLAGFNHGIYELFKWSVQPEKFQSFEPLARKGGGR